MFVARRNCLKEKGEYGGTLHQKPNIRELCNDDGDAEDDAVLKKVFIFYLQMSQLCLSVQCTYWSKNSLRLNRVCVRDVIKFSNPKLTSR